MPVSYNLANLNVGPEYLRHLIDGGRFFVSALG